MHVYTDGSVLLSHGGMEMGQGLHTKMVQVCSRLLEISPERIHIVDTNSSAVPNASPTAASQSTDLYGMAVKVYTYIIIYTGTDALLTYLQDCCDQILERLAAVKASAPEKGWDAWVKSAYMQRINLSAQGFYSSPLKSPMDWETGKGEPYMYFAYGASCTEVEIDCLSGDFIVLRTDIVNDVGDSINPAIDIGQVRHYDCMTCVCIDTTWFRWKVPSLKDWVCSLWNSVCILKTAKGHSEVSFLPQALGPTKSPLAKTFLLISVSHYLEGPQIQKLFFHLK